MYAGVHTEMHLREWMSRQSELRFLSRDQQRKAWEKKGKEP